MTWRDLRQKTAGLLLSWLRAVRSVLPIDVKVRATQLFWLKRIGTAAAMLLVIANLFSPVRHDEYDFKAGDTASRDIFAPVAFPVLKRPDSLRAEQDSAAARVLAIAYRDLDAQKKVLADLDRFLIDLANLREQDATLAAKEKTLRGWSQALSAGTVSYLLSAPSLSQFQLGLQRLCAQVLDAGVIAASDQQLRSLGTDLILRDGDQIRRLPAAGLISEESLPLVLRVKCQTAFASSESAARAAEELSRAIVTPNVFVKLDEFQAAQNDARCSVPATVGQVAKGELIVGIYQRVDDAAAQKLYSLKARLDEISLASRRGGTRYLLTLLSRLLALGFFLGIILFYLRQFRPEVFRSDRSMLLIAASILVTMLFSWLVIVQRQLSPYLIPAALGPMIISLMFDVTLGTIMAVTVSLLLGVVTGLNFPLTVVALVAGAVASFAVKGLRSRFQFMYTSFVALALVSTLAIAAVEYLRPSSFLQIRQAVIWGPANAALCVVLTVVLLPLFEALFRTTTDYTLLELADLDQPLLKRLSIEAPGTFQHGLLVGNLAEAAAKAIGANSLQARIMGYYHDIGKLTKPEYFIENQLDSANKHDTLLPKMSFLVLVSHVKDGLNLAHQHRLPTVLIDAIAQHHGTTLSKFFYNKAQKAADGTVSETDFRYPGPRPQTKEVGLLMLADVVEATVRSLREYTPSRIRRMVKATIADKASELELDESTLTLHDLNLAGESFIPLLLSVFHQRIEYPGQHRDAAGDKQPQARTT
ncbi:MAG TPA: HDIG domain-containing protein [Candidatus Edwardsbacteria bacterium]|nr:HDIG domain-containing protein [Candidatus Edwardsbacteria bacterium]